MVLSCPPAAVHGCGHGSLLHLLHPHHHHRWWWTHRTHAKPWRHGPRHRHHWKAAGVPNGMARSGPSWPVGGRSGCSISPACCVCTAWGALLRGLFFCCCRGTAPLACCRTSTRLWLCACDGAVLPLAAGGHFDAVGASARVKTWRLGLDVAAPRLTGSLVRYEPRAAVCVQSKAMSRVPVVSHPATACHENAAGHPRLLIQREPR
jgi:hypothetical protein